MVILLAGQLGGCALNGSRPGTAEEPAGSAAVVSRENDLADHLADLVFDPARLPQLSAGNVWAINSVIQRALETAPNDVSRYWASSDGRVQWWVTVTGTQVLATRICRSFSSTAEIDGQKHQEQGRACRKVNGLWVLQ